MGLPPDYRAVVAAGVSTLRDLGAAARTAADQQTDAPELWLTVRDLEGLADRLAERDEWEWQNGFGDMFIAGQDFGVLDDLLRSGVRLSSGRSIPLAPTQATSLVHLRAFLRRYANRQYGSGEPAP